MTTQGASYEVLLNAALAETLRGAGLDADPEQPAGGGKRPDVTVAESDGIVYLEAEIGKGLSGAVKDARARGEHISEGIIGGDAVVAVAYPPGLQAGDLAACNELCWVTAFPRLPERGEQEHTGGVVDLASHLRRLAAERGSPAAEAAKLNEALNRAVHEMSDKDRELLAMALDLPTVFKGADKSHAAAKRGLLVVAAAAMFHARLDDAFTDPDSRPGIDARFPDGRAYTGGWPPERAVDCADGEEPVIYLRDAWHLVLAKDYRPVFQLGREALKAPVLTTRWRTAVRIAARAGVSAAASAAASGHDLLGRIFHRLLDTARYDGSYYTSVSAATLLAALCLPDADTLPKDLADMRVIDPACGTGTLLMAAAERIRDLRGPDRREADAAVLIEHVLWGLDVNATACHMAAATLGLLSPSTAFDRMNIAKLQLGVRTQDGIPQARVGSLELLEDAATGQLRFGEERYGTQVETERALTLDPNSFHIVIMNPPYTRDSLRHDQFTAADEKALKAREKTITAGRAGHGSSGSSMFVDLGEHLADLDKGVLALVMPLTSAADPSGLKARRLLAEWFHVEWVVASFDAKRTSFSENTAISEVLVVCRRSEEPEPSKRPPTKFVRLWHNTRSSAEITGTARMLLTGEPTDAADVTGWPAERMATGVWAPLTVGSAHLADVAACLRDGTWNNAPFVPLGKIARVGPEGRRIRDAFTCHPRADRHGRKALWNNDTERVRSLSTTADTYIHAKPDKTRLASKYFAQASHLLIAAKPRLNTLRVVSVRCDEATVGSRWVPAAPLNQTHEPRWSKALAVYVNSTVGVLAVLSAAAPTILSRPNLSINAMRSIPVPRLTEQQEDALAAVFDAARDEPLLPLRDAEQCPTRRQLDDAVAAALGIAQPDMVMLRREVVSEPSVQPATSRRPAGPG